MISAPNTSRAILGGFLATIAITALMYGGPLMGMPKMDVAAMLGSVLSQEPPIPGSGAWWAGMLWHFVNGTIIFPLIYAYVLYPMLPGSPWVKGTIWGLTLWFLAQVLVNPLMGMGFFAQNAPSPMKMVIGSLFGHFIYGAILGAVAGVQGIAARTQRFDERRAA